MKTAEVKRISRAWVRSEGPKIRGYQGAYFIGSINTRSDDSNYPPTSDVDIHFVLDEGDAEALRNLHLVFDHDGLRLDRSAQPFERYQNAQNVLGSPWLASHFATNSVIEDPSGRLTSVHQYVAQHYAERAWVEKRCAQVAREFQPYMEMLVGSRSDPMNRLGLPEVVFAMAQYLLVAHLQNPTVRKAMVMSQAILAEYEQSALHEDILEMYGSATMEREEAAVHLDELRTAFDYAVTVRQTRFPYDSAVTYPARYATIDGTMALIEDGHHREAMLPLLWNRAMCQIAIDYDAPPAEQRRYDRQYEQLLQALGLTTQDDHVQRADLAQRTFDRVQVAAAAMMDKNPAIVA
jgi:hypothetical protein